MRLTVRSTVHDDETRVYINRMVTIFERNGVGVSAEAILSFVEVDFMICAFESPECSNA